MTTWAFWSTAGLLMTGAAVGEAEAAADAPGVAEAADCDWSGALLLRAGTFLQPTNPSAKTTKRIANLVSINAVRAFSLGRKKYKRFLDRTIAARSAKRCSVRGRQRIDVRMRW